MSSSLTVILLVDNNDECAKLSIESLRMFNDITDLQLVVLDNASDDGFGEWAVEQDDFTYIYMDQGKEKEGKALNDVIAELEIDTDILVMDSGMMVLPNTLKNMTAMMEKHPEVGLLGGKSNGFLSGQALRDCNSYEEAVKCASSMSETKPHYVLGLNSNAVMIRKSLIENVGLFDCDMQGLSFVMKDYYLRAIEQNLSIAVCESALFWALRNNQDYDITQNDILLENKWGMHYFNFIPNVNMVAQIHESENATFNVLEIGCDCGATLVEIKNRFPKVGVYGTDINRSAVNIAERFAITKIDNIEECKLDFGVKFKYILFGDVLEHLRNPLEVIKYCKKLLSEGGSIIANIPNLMHISVIDELLKGNFTYAERGLLDKTHIHMFTYNEIIRLFEDAGFGKIEVQIVEMPLSDEQNNAIDKIHSLYLDTPKYMFEAFQYLTCAT